MVCTSCSSEMSPSTTFCPQCGNPPHVHEAAADTAGTPAAGARADAGSTQVLDLPPVSDAQPTAVQPAPPVAVAQARRSGPPVGVRVSAATAPARRWLADSGVEVQLALAGSALVVLAFFFLPYADGLGRAVELGGRVWWRPITAVTATILLVLALRRALPAAGVQSRVTTALALAAAGAAEAGLLGLVTGNGDRLRIGYYLMLLGLVLVLVAAFLATRHPVRRVESES